MFVSRRKYDEAVQENQFWANEVSFVARSVDRNRAIMSEQRATIAALETELAELREQLLDAIDLDGQLLDANRVIDVQFKTIERLVS